MCLVYGLGFRVQFRWSDLPSVFRGAGLLNEREYLGCGCFDMRFWICSWKLVVLGGVSIIAVCGGDQHAPA